MVRFRGYTGDGNLSDMAIDDILLAEATSVPEHPSVLLGLRFFPNPTRDEVTVSFLLDPMETAILRILDLTGKTLAEASVQGTGRVTYPMSLLSLPQGTYILRVETRAAVAHEKLQIIR